jgi:trehalose/maltose hydrolase-like predicted phosphorylase
MFIIGSLEYDRSIHVSCILYTFNQAVLPPDEDAQPFKNNSVFTNAVASLSIELANRVSCITRKRVPRAWLDVAYNLHFPFDNLTQTHLEYEGFDLGKFIYSHVSCEEITG